MDILYKEETYAVMGACFEVYKEMGSGMREPIYHECLERELCSRHIPAVHEPKIELEYKGEKLTHHLIPDFITHSKIILELKAVSELNNAHRSQVHDYLHTTGHKLGLLINFGHYPQIEWERIVLDTHHPKPQNPPRLQS